MTELDASWHVLLAAGAAFVALLFYAVRHTPRRCYACSAADPDLLYLRWSGRYVYLCPACRRFWRQQGGPEDLP